MKETGGSRQYGADTGTWELQENLDTDSLHCSEQGQEQSPGLPQPLEASKAQEQWQNCENTTAKSDMHCSRAQTRR